MQKIYIGILKTSIVQGMHWQKEDGDNKEKRLMNGITGKNKDK